MRRLCRRSSPLFARHLALDVSYGKNGQSVQRVHTVPGTFASKITLFEEVVLHRRLIDRGEGCEEAETEDTYQSDLGTGIELQFPY